MREKSITIRLPKDEYLAFDTVCNEKGYSKTGKIRELIRNLVKAEIDEVRISAEEWSKIGAGMSEIERGEYVSLKDLKRDFAKKKVDRKQDS